MRCEGYMLVTKDIRATTAFYQNVIGAKVELDIGDHVIFKEGFSLLQEKDWREFAGLRDTHLSYPHYTGQLVFEVDDISTFVEHLGKYPDLAILHPVKEHHWGRKAIRLCDPDGHIVEVGESMKIVVKRFLRQGLTPEEAACKSEFPLSFVLACQQEMKEQKPS